MLLMYLTVFAPDMNKLELERVAGIEPVSKAWEAFVLPLNYTRSAQLYNAER